MNIDFAKLIGDPAVLYPCLLVLLLAATTVIVVLALYRSTLARMNRFSATVRGRLASWRTSAPKGPADPLWEPFERVFVFRADQASPIVVSEWPDEGFERQSVALTRSGLGGSFLAVIGEHLTAIALTLTFFLLGIVLVGDIHKALLDSSDQPLADGLRKMGAKFFVSALGIGGAWLYYALTSLTTDRIRKRAAEISASTHATLEHVQTFHARTSHASAKQLVTLNSDLVQIGESWRAQLEKLGSIDVSIQGISEQVTSHAGTLMKQHIADIICDSIRKLEDSAAKIALEMSATLQHALTTQMGQLSTGLEGVQNAIQGQAQGTLEKLVTQIGDTFSGGFNSQSENIGHQIGQLAEVLPKLEAQFSSMTENLGQNAQRWGDENQRAVLELANQVAGLVGQFESVRAGMEQSVRELAEASHRTIQGVGDAASSQAQAIGQELATFRQSASDSASQFEQRVQAYTDLMHKTQLDLATSNGTIRETLGLLVSAVQQTKQLQANQQAVFVAFERVAAQMVDGGRRMEAVVGKQPEVVAMEEHLVAVQREAVDRVAVVLDAMLKNYSNTLTKQSGDLAASWQQLASTVKNTVQQASVELADAVGGLDDSVKALKGILGPKT